MYIVVEIWSREKRLYRKAAQTNTKQINLLQMGQMIREMAYQPVTDSKGDLILDPDEPLSAVAFLAKTQGGPALAHPASIRFSVS